VLNIVERGAKHHKLHIGYLCDMMPSCKICIPLVNKMPTDTGEQRCCNKMEKKKEKKATK
jgi:hypothetical protein